VIRAIADRARGFWIRFWMRWAGLGPMGRIATRLATWLAPPYRARKYLARLNRRGYVAPSAIIHHRDLRLGANVFIGDRVTIFQNHEGGFVALDDRVHVYTDSCFETGEGGSIMIGAETSIHPRCQLMAYKGAIRIGRGVALAPNCALYPYDHGVAPGMPIRRQPLTTKGDIIIDDEAWLGTNVTVLSGVRIGKGAVVGAGSVVTTDVPDDAIAVGVPARVVKSRRSSESFQPDVHARNVTRSSAVREAL
jgi:acetyltransferase-like isoleucine patch superfamily enzyme